MSRRWLRAVAALVVAVAVIGPRLARGQQDDDYFKGKTITVYVGQPPGGGYDLYGRLLARHLGRHLPGNPTVIVSNMPGAQGIQSLNFMYHLAPRDGTALALAAQYACQDQVVGTLGVQYDAAKFNWIGRLAANVDILYVWNTVPIKTATDLESRETLLASDGGLATNYAALLHLVMGAQLKLVRGYPGTQAVNLALERGEAEAAVSSLNTIRTIWGEWLRTGKIRVLVQNRPSRHPDLADVPTIDELPGAAEHKDVVAFFVNSALMGRSILAPPEVPADRVTMLREAFDATMKDELFQAETKQSNVEIDPMGGAEVQKLSERLLSVDAAARSLLTNIFAGN